MADCKETEAGKTLTEKLTWKDIIINQDTKDVLQDFCTTELVNFKAYHQWGCKPPKGILLYGPPGTGKSLVLRIIGDQTPYPFFPIDVSVTGSKYINESANRLNCYFERVGKIAAKYGAAFICFDEIDGLLMPRGGFTNHAEDHKVVTTFTKHMEGLAEHPGLYVFAATNMDLNLMDPAVIRAGRFDIKFYVGLPDEGSRAKIFRLHLEKKQRIAMAAGNSSFMEPLDYLLLAQKTPEFSGADINAVIHLVCTRKRREAIMNTKTGPITMQDMLEQAAGYKGTSQQGKKQLGFRQ